MMPSLLTDTLEPYTRASAAPDPLALANHQAPTSAELLKFDPDGHFTLITSPFGNIRIELPTGSENSEAGASKLLSASARFIPYLSAAHRIAMRHTGKTPLECTCEAVAVNLIWEDPTGSSVTLRRQNLVFGSAMFSGSHPEYTLPMGRIVVRLIVHEAPGLELASRGWAARAA